MSAASNSPQQLPALSQKLGEVILTLLQKNIFHVATFSPTSLFSKMIFILDLCFFRDAFCLEKTMSKKPSPL